MNRTSSKRKEYSGKVTGAATALNYLRHRKHPEHVSQQPEEQEYCPAEKEVDEEQQEQEEYEYEEELAKKNAIIWWRRVLPQMLFRRIKANKYNAKINNKYSHERCNERRAVRLRHRHVKEAMCNSANNRCQKEHISLHRTRPALNAWSEEDEFSWQCCLWMTFIAILVATLCFGVVLRVIYIREEEFREWVHSMWSTDTNNLWAWGRQTTTMVVNGESTLEHPELFPSLHIKLPRKMSSKELLQHYNDVDFVYTYVNGSESNHVYRKLIWKLCGPEILEEQEQEYREYQEHHYKELEEPKEFLKSEMPYHNNKCQSRLFELSTTREVLEYIASKSSSSVNSRDRDWNELRYSIRSVEKYIAWHRGRLIIVSPGHIPSWLHLARHFFGNNSEHVATLTSEEEVNHWVRTKTEIVNSYKHITLVHQDALLPHYMHWTFNSHTIEEHLWRLHHLTPMHIYFNDDYFVNRQVEITDFFNTYGGSIIRVESRKVQRATRAHEQSIAWSDSIKHNHLFATIELDIHPEDYLPPALGLKWSEHIMEEWELKREANRSANRYHSIVVNTPLTTPLSHIIDVALNEEPPSLPWSITPHDLALQDEMFLSMHTETMNMEEDTTRHVLRPDEKLKKYNKINVSNLEEEEEEEQYEEELYSYDDMLESSSANSEKPITHNTPENNNNNYNNNNNNVIKKRKTSETQIKVRRWKSRWEQTHLPTHTPFVYCTNMFRFIATRYERELSHVDWFNRERMATNYLMPIMYSAFTLSRPWQASPAFLIYLMHHHNMINFGNTNNTNNNTNSTSTNNNNISNLESSKSEQERLQRAALEQSLESLVINLNNVDGCAPATQFIGKATDTLYMTLTHDKATRTIMGQRLERRRPLFFNINAGCNTTACAKYMYLLLESKYAEPIYLDNDDELVHEPSERSVAINTAFDSLMQIPLFVLISFTSNVCPFIRSLQLAMPAFVGEVHIVLVANEYFKEEEEKESQSDEHVFYNSNVNNNNSNVVEKGNASNTLEKLREMYHFTLQSKTPVLGCTYNDKVHLYKYYSHPSSLIEQTSSELKASEIVRRVLFSNTSFMSTFNANVVKLPSFVNTRYADKNIAALVIDTRLALHKKFEVIISKSMENNLTNEVKVMKKEERQQFTELLRTILAIPAQLLSLKDFTPVPLSINDEQILTSTNTTSAEDNDTVTSITNKQKSELLKSLPSSSSLLVLERKDKESLYSSNNNDDVLHWITGGTEQDLLISFPLPYSKYENIDAPPRWIR